MGTAEDECVDLRVETHDVVDTLLDEVIGTGTVGFVVLDDRNPQRTGNAGDGDVRPELLYLHVVALTADCSLSGQDAHVAGFRQLADNLRGRTDYSKYTAVWVEFRQVFLLNAAESLCRGGVTAEDDKVATHREELDDCLAGELIDDVERAWSVRRTGVVAKVYVVVVGQQLADTVEDSQSTIAGVEHSYWSRILRELIFHSQL